jgi:D-inositol-3-phosphate glycosyltransferase
MKKKIAFISEHASPLATLGGVDSGGQNVYVAELAKHLARSGFDIDIYTRKDHPALPEIYYWAPGVRVIHAVAGPEDNIAKEELLQYMPAFRDYMLSFISQHQLVYDVIHANFFMSALVASDIRKELRIPFVVTFHALGHVRRIHQKEQDKFPPERLQIEENIVKDADQIIAECPQDREDLINYYQADPEKITIIPCGFSAEEFYPVDRSLARKIIDVNPDEKILLQLGRMVPRKGVDNVIRSLARVKSGKDKLKLLIVGGETDTPDPQKNPEIARLQKIAEEEGVLDSVVFVGRKNRIMLKYYYSAADIFITTPWYEPFGITPLEAMACGTPVIGADVGGIKYSVAHGKTGWLVPANDPEKLAEKIDLMISDEKLLHTMKTNAVRRVNALFTWAKVSNSVSSLYERLSHVDIASENINAKPKTKNQAA